jgi:hypothetical protein
MANVKDEKDRVGGAKDSLAKTSEECIYDVLNILMLFQVSIFQR